MLFALLSATLAEAQAPSADASGPPFTVVPYGYVVPSFSWIQDDPAAISAQDGFQLAARLGVDAGFRAAPLGAHVELELTPQPSLKDGVIWYKPAPFLRLDMGQFKVPYGVGYLAADTRHLLPSVPLVYTDMTARDLGFMLTGALPIREKTYASVQLGAFNGEGANRLQNVNQKYLYAVRGLVTPFGARSTTFEGTDGTLYLGVGGGWTYNWLGDGDSSEEINQYAGELQFAWNVVSLQGELLLGQHGFANASVTDYTQVGWYGTAATYIPAPWLKDHVQVVARLGQSEPDDQMVGDPAGQVQPATREITGGANLYWMGAPRPFHDVKLQLAYSHFQELEGVDFLNDRLTAAATARF